MGIANLRGHKDCTYSSHTEGFDVNRIAWLDREAGYPLFKVGESARVQHVNKNFLLLVGDSLDGDCQQDGYSSEKLPTQPDFEVNLEDSLQQKVNERAFAFLKRIDKLKRMQNEFLDKSNNYNESMKPKELSAGEVRPSFKWGLQQKVSHISEQVPAVPCVDKGKYLKIAHVNIIDGIANSILDSMKDGSFNKI